MAYANADFSEPNSKSVALFSEKFPGFNGQQIIDLGCGPADITMRLAEQYPQAKVIGLDGADAMLEIARKEILRHSSLANRVDIRKWHIGRQENPLGSEAFHAVVSNSLLHHMHDPLDLWRAIRACAAPGAAVLVMDLIRPQSRIEAENIVEKYAGKEPEVEHEFPRIGRRIMLLNARKVFDADHAHTTLLLAFEDVTERRAIEREKEELLRQTEELLRQKDVLLREMEHRVANSLQIIASILMLKARTVTSEETRQHARLITANIRLCSSSSRR